MKQEKKKLIILTGPTAVGKTDLSIQLARQIGGEIISADSIQVYRHMDIGSAKITREEMQGIPHHLIDIMEPEESFNVQVFQTLAKQCMEEIYARNHIPIIVGGTGFYIQSVLYDIQFDETDDGHEYRHTLERLAQEKGNAYLHEMLKHVDPASAENIHANNVKRVIRALEYYHDTGKPISAHNEVQRQNTSPYQFAYFVLKDDRQALYERINARVDIMLANGLVEEVKKLMEMGYDTSLTSMQGIGYKEIASYLKGELSFEDAVDLLKKDTRHFAKRQLTWFRREKEVCWVDVRKHDYDKEKILHEMFMILEELSILKEDDRNNE